MVPLEYAYFVFSLLFTGLYLFLFVKRPDLRLGMNCMGVVLIVAGVIGQYAVWTVDWWRPVTLTNTRIGIEDILHSFTIGGIGVGLYPFIFRKKIVHQKKHKLHLLPAGIVSIGCVVLSLVLFYFFSVHSFYATLCGATAMFLFLISQRRELFSVSILSGFFLFIVSIPVYLVLGELSPQFLARSWIHENLSGLIWFSAPVEDLVFYASVGAVVLPLYLYGFGVKLTGK